MIPVPADEVNRDVPNIVAKTIQEAVDPDPAKRISMSKFLERLEMAQGLLNSGTPTAAPKNIRHLSRGCISPA